MNQKILLITPPGIEMVFPRGIMEIASFLESKRCPVEVLSLSYYLLDDGKIKNKPKEMERQIRFVLEKTIKRIDPTIIGISNQFTKDYPDCVKILEICKKINNRFITVIGGPHVTFLDSDCAKSPFIDVVVRGEGEWTMLDLVLSCEKQNNLENVKGITFKRNDKIIRTPDRPLGDLDELPPINFGLLPHSFVESLSLFLMINRGCAFNCRFCAEKIFWKERRAFRVQRMINELKIFEGEYKNKPVALDDSMLHLGAPQFLEISSELVKHKIKISPNFYIQSRVDTISDEGIRALKKAGIKCVWLGIESASAKVLRMMNKNITSDEIITACRKLRENDINVNAFWIIGHPGDEPQEAAYSAAFFNYLFSHDLIQFAEINLFIPYPGTPFFNCPEKYGIEILSYDYQKWQRWCDRPICQLKGFPVKQIAAFYNVFQGIMSRYMNQTQKQAYV